MNKENEKELLEQVWEKYSVNEIIKAGIELKKCDHYSFKDEYYNYVRTTLERIDKNEVYELFSRIKDMMIDKGRTHLILQGVDINEQDIEYQSDFDNYDEIDEDMEFETRLVCYDCGDYARELLMIGLILEDDVLKLLLVERHSYIWGGSDENLYVVDFDMFMNRKSFWWQNTESDVIFDPIRVLNYYISVLSNDTILQQVVN